MTQKVFGLGVFGCGGFGLFALQHFTQHPRVKLAGLASTHRDAAYAAAERFGVPEPMEVEDLVARDDVDIVYISTPPFLHFEQAMIALRAGKHVICEKPLALNLEQAGAMLEEARSRNRLLVTNLMQRYNPMFDVIRNLIQQELLGDFLHGYFENYAADEGLAPDHWFWDREKSGGIFIEHGVHFFDLFEGWLGPGEVASGHVSKRPGTPIEDQVQCTARYEGGGLVSFYHGFTQPGRMDRQEWRLLFERGDITMTEWVPTFLTIRAVANERQTRALMDLMPRAQLDVTTNYAAKDRPAMGRHKQLDIYQMIEIAWGAEKQKMHLYGQLLRSMIDDQIKYLDDPSHERRITEQNGRDSLAMACRADALAHTQDA